MKAMKTQVIFFICFLPAVLLNAQGPQPRRPENFTPFHFPYTVEKLRNDVSADVMKKAAEARNQMREIIKQGPYKPDPDYNKLDRHRLPEWFKDAKFGIFLDWGVWSVPGYGRQGYHGNYYPDTYLGYMYNDDGTKMDYHIKFWGNDFERDDFIPLFTASKFNAEEFARQCTQWGVKYVVPFCKHGDGYCIWNNSYTFRDATDMPPHRDLLGEMYSAFRRNGIKCGFYYTVYEFEYPLISNKKIYIGNVTAQNAPDPSVQGSVLYNAQKHDRRISGKIPVENYLTDYFVPSLKEVIDVYDPDILWFDNEWYNTGEKNNTIFITSYFYNKAEGTKEVAVNDRFGTDSRELHGDFYTSEYHVIIENRDHYWEENRPMGYSYGYNWLDNDSSMLSAERLIEMLVRIVARNGNLLLMICPDGEGRIPAEQVARMNEIGEWLKVNGEAIYNTRPAPKACDESNTGDNVWYTQSKDGKYTYVHFFEWPSKGFLIFKNARPKWEKKVYLLGCDIPLVWWATEGNEPYMYVETPPGMTEKSAPCKHAWVIRYENW